MSVGARLFLVLLGLVLAAAGLLAGVLGFDLVQVPGLGTSLLAPLAGAPVVAAAGGGLLLAAVILLVLGLRSTRTPVPESVLQTSELGEIRIAIVAMENMVLRVLQQIPGVKDGGRRVYPSTEGLVVQIRIKVMPDLELPGLVSELQEKVKGYLEQITGLVVHEVKVLVENIILDQVPGKKIIRPNWGEVVTELNWWTLMSKHWGKILGGLLGLIFAILVIALKSFWWAVFIYFCVAAGIFIGWRLDAGKGLKQWLDKVFGSKDEL